MRYQNEIGIAEMRKIKNWRIFQRTNTELGNGLTRRGKKREEGKREEDEWQTIPLIIADIVQKGCSCTFSPSPTLLLKEEVLVCFGQIPGQGWDRDGVGSLRYAQNRHALFCDIVFLSSTSQLIKLETFFFFFFSPVKGSRTLALKSRSMRSQQPPQGTCRNADSHGSLLCYLLRVRILTGVQVTPCTLKFKEYCCSRK